MVTPAQIHGYLQDKLECTHIEVDGDGAHFQAVIVSNVFDGKSRVARHQIVYGALGDRMREEIHALSMQTLTLAEWQARQNQSA